MLERGSGEGIRRCWEGGRELGVGKLGVGVGL